MIGKKNYVSPLTPATFHGRLGEADTTLTLLEKGYEQRAPDVLRIQNDPAYDFLHSDPAIERWCRRSACVRRYSI